jgi:rsbT co-antagonist protein RsbR
MMNLEQSDLISLLENAPNIVLIVDQEGLIQYINRVVPGINRDEIIGRSQYDFIEPEYRDLVKNSVEKVFRTGEPDEYEIRGQGPDGKTAWYSTSVGPIKVNGDVSAVSLFSSDITDRKTAVEDLRKTKDELIKEQSKAIDELSTPVIQVWDEILILPLIGTIDTLRAKQIVENLLEAIVKTKASVAIMDVTGVATVDTSIANHLLKTIEAAKLLGAKVILTGVSPNNAQTLVKLGVDLGNVTTKSSLQAGLRMAFELTNRKVTGE